MPAAAQVDRFLDDVSSARLLQARRITSIAVERPEDDVASYRLPCLQFILFGKDRLLSPEEKWLEPLTEGELERLSAAPFHFESSPAAFYQEKVNGQNVFNRLVDVCLVSFEPELLQPAWEKLQQNAERRRQRSLARGRHLARLLRRAVRGSTVRSIAVRGQAAQAGRLQGVDLDLLVFVRSEQAYPTLRAAAQRLVRSRVAEMGSLSFLGVDFTEAESSSYEQADGDRDALRLDLFVTVGEAELERVLHGCPVGAYWNLQVLRGCVPVLGREWFQEFVGAYETALGVRAKRPIAVAGDSGFHTVGLIPHSDVSAALDRGLRALRGSAPRIRTWDSRGTDRSFLSPFVAALIVEATMETGSGSSPEAVGARDYLLETMEGEGRWRFAPNAIMEWPPDIDDTVCALAALVRLGRQPAAAGIHRTISEQLEPSGLLRTWLPEANASGRFNDPDVIVTANAALLLHRLGQGQTSLVATLERAIHDHLSRKDTLNPDSLYYKEPAVCAYFLSRWAAVSRSSVAEEVLAWVAERLPGLAPEGQGAAQLAAAACAAIWAGNEPAAARMIAPLLAYQRSTGLWPVAPLVAAPGDGKYGSAEASTALAIQALSLWLSRRRAVPWILAGETDDERIRHG